MENKSSWLQDFETTSEDIIQDMVLLEAMEWRLSRDAHGVLRLPPEVGERALRRVGDYLSQHIWDLHVLTLRLE